MTGNEYQGLARRTQIPYDTMKDKLKARFPDGFNPEQSLHRKAGLL